MIASVETMHTLGAGLIRPEMIIFPVRHHSPACAWYLRQTIERFSPSAILVEGPRSFTSHAALLTSPDAKMPLAIYTYAVQRGSEDTPESRRAAFYPFCDYSPELVAVREAHTRGIPFRFIDLDFSEQSLISSTDDDEPESLLDESYYERSNYLRVLAQNLCCRDQEELWEHLFEGASFDHSIEEHITRVAAYCHFARIDSREEELTADGTLQREAEMAWHIQQALETRGVNDGPVLAVMGGFHAVAMPTWLAGAVKRPSISKSRISEEASALVRYSFDRLDRLNGYSSGMTSPAWHQLLWERIIKFDKAKIAQSPKIRQDAALSILFDIAFELRERHGIALPMPALTAAYEHTLQLAALRQRPAPLREDVRDAVVSCFVKGDVDADGALVLAVAHRLFSGQANGVVPAGASTPPLVRDFSNRARRQRLKVDDAEPRRATLEIYRRPDHRVTSRLFHSLVFMEIPFASRRAGPDFVSGSGLDRIQEHWEYSYSAATEAALVEASVFGATIPLAVANRFTVKLSQLENAAVNRDAQTAASLLIQACVLGIHDHFPKLTALLREAIANDAVFESVVAAAGSIAMLLEAREPLEAIDVAELPMLLQAAYERAIYLGQNLPASGNSEAPMQALAKLRELLISPFGCKLDGELYWGMIDFLFVKHPEALIRGTCAGILYTAGRLPELDLSAALAGHLTGMADPRESVAFLRGLLHTAREVAWQQAKLLEILDKLIEQWNEDAFVAMLPELRLSFAEMTPKETDRIAAAVANLHGIENLGRLVHYNVSEQEIQLYLSLSASVREVLAADGLKGWLAT